MITQQALKQVDFFISQEQIPQARAVLREVLKREPKNPKAKLLLENLSPPGNINQSSSMTETLSLQPVGVSNITSITTGGSRVTGKNVIVGDTIPWQFVSASHAWIWYFLGFLIFCALSFLLGPIIFPVIMAILEYLGMIISSFIEWLGFIFQYALIILFFPVLLPLAMIISTALVGLFFTPLLNLTRVGIWLLQQPWWWFPVGHICGVIYVFGFMR